MHDAAIGIDRRVPNTEALSSMDKGPNCFLANSTGENDFTLRRNTQEHTTGRTKVIRVIQVICRDKPKTRMQAMSPSRLLAFVISKYRYQSRGYARFYASH